MKGQASVMEYMVLVVMIMFIIFFVLVLLFGFQFFSAGSERIRINEKKSMFTLQAMVTSYELNNPQFREGSMFDDSKLTTLTDESGCKHLESLFGEGIYFEVRSFIDKSVCEEIANKHRKMNCIKALTKQENTECNVDNYPNCAVWKVCEKKDRMAERSVPVNIFRKINNTISLGVLKVAFEEASL